MQSIGAEVELPKYESKAVSACITKHIKIIIDIS